MRLLVLTQFYHPDLSAGSFRMTALVEELSRRLNGRGEIHVVTSQPSRYRSYRITAPAREQRGNVCIERIRIPVHSSGMADQARSYAVFAREVVRRTRGGRYDVVFATSSRLMTAVLGARIASRTGVPLYLDIRDIFTDSMTDVLRGSAARSVLPALRLLERWAVRRADRISLASPGFLEHFQSLRSDIEYQTFINGVDELFVSSEFSSREDRSRDRTLIVYAGNIGQGQGLDRIVPAAAELLVRTHEFLLVGDGGTRRTLEARLSEMGICNVRIMDPVPRDKLLDLYREADILFLHLNDFPAFRKVLPSKLFEYAATGKPILAGVSGYARRFVENEITNAAVFNPCSVGDMVKAIDCLEIKVNPRADFVKRFERKKSIGMMAGDIIKLGKSGR